MRGIRDHSTILLLPVMPADVISGIGMLNISVQDLFFASLEVVPGTCSCVVYCMSYFQNNAVLHLF
jgi:hypothetical protein